ncbi:MAG TPA: 3-isopropylmalate dehydratase small subunit [Gemmatimonadaceae bacterium]|nr:3-isopropylmalate dehydratase small subunit [Gemmatimonadaceae bacterium]
MDPFTSLVSTAVVLRVDNVDTDQIIPARFLKITDRDGLGPHAFADWRYDASGTPRADFPLNAPGAGDAKILVAGRNFGCGSSREHAAWALHALGIRVIVCPSFADIFRNNAHANGMLPVALNEPEHALLLDALTHNPALPIAVDLASQSLTAAGLHCTFSIDPFAKHCLLRGVDTLGFLLAAAPEITAYEASHHAPVCCT